MATKAFDPDGYARKVQEYLGTAEAKRRWREYRSGRGWSWERFVAESVMFVTRLIVYERIAAVTDKLLGRPEGAWHA